MVVAWVASVIRRDASIVDRFWGLGFVLIASVVFTITEPDTVRETLTVLLVTLWGLRLSIGDALVWWGLFAFAFATPGGWWTVYGPALMTLLLMRVSGVSLLEKRLRETKP